ncbi:MAG: putative transcriptional regulator [Micrococcaceae bacterium]|nr:putative transcriptional regulator [Micrococcaceae bacterium]
MDSAVHIRTQDARERILEASYELFVARGVRSVGVNEIVDTAGVTRTTFYSHFPSKNDLIAAFFDRRKTLFTLGYLTAESEARASTPREQLLAILDIFDEWFKAPDFAGCPYVRALLEAGPRDPVGAASLAYLDDIRSTVKDTATALGLSDPDDFAYCWVLLLQGAIASAVGIDPHSGARLKKMGQHLIKLHTPLTPNQPRTRS